MVWVNWGVETQVLGGNGRGPAPRLSDTPRRRFTGPRNPYVDLERGNGKTNRHTPLPHLHTPPEGENVTGGVERGERGQSLQTVIKEESPGGEGD